jgi:hypothetical protein
MIFVGGVSNHWHGVFVDKQGHLPHFLEHFHKLLVFPAGTWGLHRFAGVKPGVSSWVSRIETVVDALSHLGYRRPKRMTRDR